MDGRFTHAAARARVRSLPACHDHRRQYVGACRLRRQFGYQLGACKVFVRQSNIPDWARSVAPVGSPEGAPGQLHGRRGSKSIMTSERLNPGFPPLRVMLAERNGAADRELARDQYNLARLNLTSDGLPPVHAEAMPWHQKAPNRAAPPHGLTSDCFAQAHAMTPVVASTHMHGSILRRPNLKRRLWCCATKPSSAAPSSHPR
jgi:hypothetical protein